MKSALNVTGEVGELVLEGELTIAEAEELKSILQEALEKSEQLNINLEKVTEADLSCLQLLCSTFTSCQTVNKQLTLSNNDSDVITQSIENAGYTEFFEKICVR